MSIQIDHACNVIANKNGIAHRPGYVLTERSDGKYALYAGSGVCFGGKFIVKRSDKALLIVDRPIDLTMEKFINATGWLYKKRTNKHELSNTVLVRI